jgi:hypothetical protein
MAVCNTRYGTYRTTKAIELASSLAHALLEPLHHLLVCRHPWPARTTVLLVCRGEPECFALGIADDVCVRLGPQRGAVDYAFSLARQVGRRKQKKKKKKKHTARGGEVRLIVWDFVVARAAVRECELGLFRLFDVSQTRAGRGEYGR